MSKFDAENAADAGANSFLDKRRLETTLLVFKQLDPASIVNGIPTSAGYLTRDFIFAGEIRETCPECQTPHLKLVLLQVGVIKPHLVCPLCTRCFDAFYVDGTPALETPFFCSFD